MDFLRDSYKSEYISTQTSTDVTGMGSTPVTCKLIRIILGETAAGTITVYDALAGATTTTKLVLKASIAEQTFECGMTFSRGIQVVTAAASKLTVVWSKV